MTTARTENGVGGLPARRQAILRWAALGALSGLCATLSIYVFEWAGLYRERSVDVGSFGVLDPVYNIVSLSISPLSVGPGLVFGLIAGWALRRRGLVDGWRYPAYVAASTLSYFAAVQLAFNVLNISGDDVIVTGVVAGLFGAGLLTGATAAMIPAFRQRRVCALMVLAGAGLGMLLIVTIAYFGFFGLLALFVPWQAGFAAAMATAFDRR